MPLCRFAFAALPLLSARNLASVQFCGFAFAALPLREIHRASECALQCPQRPIASRGEANLASPRGFQKDDSLIICNLVKINSRGEFHEAPPYLPGFCSGFGDLYYAVFRCCAVGREFLRDRSWVAVAPEALAKSRSEHSLSCFAAPCSPKPCLWCRLP